MQLFGLHLSLLVRGGTAPAVTSTPGDFNAEDIVASSSSDEDDDAMSYFAKLAEE